MNLLIVTNEHVKLAPPKNNYTILDIFTLPFKRVGKISNAFERSLFYLMLLIKRLRTKLNKKTVVL